jgi:hypothetical protein
MRCDEHIAPAAGEGQQIRRVQVLVAEHQHAMIQECSANIREPRVIDLAQVEIDDLRADGAGQRSHGHRVGAHDYLPTRFGNGERQWPTSLSRTWKNRPRFRRLMPM